MKSLAQNTEGAANQTTDSSNQLVSFTMQSLFNQQFAKARWPVGPSLTLLWLLAFIASHCTAQEQHQKDGAFDEPPEKIVAAFVEAIGGELRLRAIGDVQIKGRVEYADQANRAVFTMRFSGGKFFGRHKNRTHSTHRLGFDGSETNWEGFTDDKWTVGKAKVTKVRMLKSPTQIIDWIDNPPAMARIGHVKFADREAVRIDFTYADNVVFQRYFDLESKSLLGEVSKNMERRFEYKKHDGVLFFDRIDTISSGSHYCQWIVEDLQTNVTLDENLFVPPEEDD